MLKLEELHKNVTKYEKWIWKMAWCRAMSLNPAFQLNWEKAEEAYNKALEESKNV